MIVVAVPLVAGIVAGGSAWLVLRRWSVLEPSAPHLRASTVASMADRHPTLLQRLRAHLDPAGVVGALLGIGAIAVVVATSVVGLMALMVRTHSGFARLDSGAARWAGRHATSSSSDVLGWITDLGSTVFVVALVAVVGIVELRRSRRWSVLGFLALAIIGQNIVVNVTKVAVGRARPVIDGLVGAHGPSFPSGHSAAAAAGWAAAALIIGRRRSRRVRAALAATAIGIAVAVAATRVLLGAHWLTDVIAGLAVGWGWFALVSIAFGGRWLHFGAPAEEMRDAMRPATRDGRDDVTTAP